MTNSDLIAPPSESSSTATLPIKESGSWMIAIQNTMPNVVSVMVNCLVVIMVIDGFILGRKVNRLVDEKFPDNTESGWKLGFYAASRASQLRRMRAPRPQVNRGDKVA